MKKTTCAGFMTLAALGLAFTAPAAPASTTITEWTFANENGVAGDYISPASDTIPGNTNATPVVADPNPAATNPGQTTNPTFAPEVGTGTLSYTGFGTGGIGTSTATDSKTPTFTFAAAAAAGKTQATPTELRLGSVGYNNAGTEVTNNGSTIQFNADITNYNGITVSYDTSASNATTAFQTQNFEYSIDGGNTFTTVGTVNPVPPVPTVGTVANPSAPFTLETFDLSGVTFSPVASNNVFEIELDGATNATSTAAPNDRIANVTISGTADNPGSPAPEPSQVGMMALMGLGLGGLLLRARRRQSAA